MRKAMAETILAKNAVIFFEKWSAHLRQGKSFLLPASGVEIDRASFH